MALVFVDLLDLVLMSCLRCILVYSATFHFGFFPYDSIEIAVG